MRIEVDASALIKELETIVSKSETAWATTGEVFRKITPIKTGNARKNTRYNISSKEILADYPYGARLDDGYSKQAPMGMSDPALAYFEQQLQRILR